MRLEELRKSRMIEIHQELVEKRWIEFISNGNDREIFESGITLGGQSDTHIYIESRGRGRLGESNESRIMKIHQDSTEK